jgi:hypothetical protein
MKSRVSHITYTQKVCFYERPLVPSWRQPSPAKHTTFWSKILWSLVLKWAWDILHATAYPTAFPTPWPRGPVVASTPGVSLNSGCPMCHYEKRQTYIGIERSERREGKSGHAWGGRAQLPELLDVIQGYLVTRQVQPRIEEHRSMSCWKDEDITVQPFRLCKVRLLFSLVFI